MPLKRENYCLCRESNTIPRLASPSPVRILTELCWLNLKLEFPEYELRVRSMDKKNQLDVTFVFFISLLLVAQHVSGNHVPIIRS